MKSCSHLVPFDCGASLSHVLIITAIVDDDAFITLWVSTLSGISQMTSRFMYGTLLDVVPFSLLVGVQSLILGTGFVFFYPVALLGEVPYVLWLHLIYITFPGIYAILPGRDLDQNFHFAQVVHRWGLTVNEINRG